MAKKTASYQVKTAQGRYVQFDAKKRRIVGNTPTPAKGVPVRKPKK